MKRVACFIVTLLFCLCCGCTTPVVDLVAEYTVPDKPLDFSISADQEAIIPQIDNETPYRELLTKEVDIHDFMEKYCIRSYDGGGYLHTIASYIGIECLRKTEDGAIYSIHKVKQGGLLYIFYYDYQGQTELAQAYVLRCFYMQKKRSSKDFASIRVGTPIEKLKEIDPTAQIGENLYHSDPEWWEGCQTLHYLSDGILEYYLKEENGTLRVNGVYLTEDFNIVQNTGKTYPYNGRILPQDWVEE